MDLFLLLMAGTITGLSGAMIPGPLFLFTVSESLRKDARVGVKVALGHILIEALFIVFILAGFKDFLKSPNFLKVVSLIGAFSLMGMGLIIIRKIPQMSLASKKQVDFGYGLLTGGMFFSAISPGFIIWWATIGISLFLQALLFGMAGLIMFTLGHWISDIAWHYFISYSIDKGRHYLSDLIYQKIILVLAVGLIVMGLFFLLQSFSRF